MTVGNLFATLANRQPWTADALCAEVDAEMFFPDKGGSTREAKRICGLCEVRTQCLQAALDNEERFGIWGGLSERERRHLKRPLRTSPSLMRTRNPLELSAGLSHGTRGGYNAGCRCRPCCAADGWYQRRRHKERGNYGGPA